MGATPIPRPAPAPAYIRNSDLMKTIDAADADTIGGFGANGDVNGSGHGSRVGDDATAEGADPEYGVNWLVEQR